LSDAEIRNPVAVVGAMAGMTPKQYSAMARDLPRHRHADGPQGTSYSRADRRLAARGSVHCVGRASLAAGLGTRICALTRSFSML
jgi:hypothetical protein